MFPNATIWRGDFFALRPILALIGHASDAPLDPAVAERWLRLQEAGALDVGGAAASLPFMLHAGSLADSEARLAGAAPNTDDLPWVSFAAPVSQRQRAAGLGTAFVGEALAAFLGALREDRPAATDPYLGRLTPAQRDLVEGGQALYDYAVAKRLGDRKARHDAWKEYVRRVPSTVRPALHVWVR